MVPVDSFVCELVHRLRFFRSLDPLPADGRLLACPGTKQALVRQLRDYLHQVCHSIGLSTRIVPHQFRHTYASEMLRAGVSFLAVMKLLGHTSPEMTMRYLDVVLTDLQREFELARSKPRHLAPQPKASFASLRTGLGGVIDSLLAAQHVLEMFCQTDFLAVASTASLTASPKSSAKRDSSRHPENGQGLAGNARHSGTIPIGPPVSCEEVTST